MNRIEMNVITGEQKIVELTPEEIADALARTAAEAAKPPPLKTLQNGELAELLVSKNIITQADIQAALGD